MQKQKHYCFLYYLVTEHCPLRDPFYYPHIPCKSEAECPNNSPCCLDMRNKRYCRHIITSRWSDWSKIIIDFNGSCELTLDRVWHNSTGYRRKKLEKIFYSQYTLSVNRNLEQRYWQLISTTKLRERKWYKKEVSNWKKNRKILDYQDYRWNLFKSTFIVTWSDGLFSPVNKKIDNFSIFVNGPGVASKLNNCQKDSYFLYYPLQRTGGGITWGIEMKLGPSSQKFH